MNPVTKRMIEIGYEQLNGDKQEVPFTKNQEWDKLLNDIENYSHLFVLGCLADKQITANRAWSIPMKIGEEIQSFDFADFFKLSLSEYFQLFKKNRYHIYNSIVGEQFYEAVQKIHYEYNGAANQIWKASHNSAEIFGKFLQFNGIGQKIASMAINILVRHFKEPIKDLQWIDVSPDRHVIRVFKRSGLIRPDASKEEIVWRAKELNPKYPGVFDISTFMVGKNYCNPTNPNCSDCILTHECEKLIE